MKLTSTEEANILIAAIQGRSVSCQYSQDVAQFAYDVLEKLKKLLLNGNKY